MEDQVENGIGELGFADIIKNKGCRELNIIYAFIKKGCRDALI